MAAPTDKHPLLLSRPGVLGHATQPRRPTRGDRIPAPLDGLAHRKPFILGHVAQCDGTTGTCDLYGDKLPVQFLGAAHVKRRSVCSESERLDIPAVAIVDCKFGCDALFEEGYLAVDDQGAIVISPLAPKQWAAAGYLARLCGRVTPAFNPDRAAYFAWHHGHTYRR